MNPSLRSRSILRVQIFPSVRWMLVKKKLVHVVVLTVFPAFSGVFELNFMSEQPASGYYQFTVAVTGDSRLVANHVEASFHHELVFIFMMVTQSVWLYWTGRAAGSALLLKTRLSLRKLHVWWPRLNELEVSEDVILLNEWNKAFSLGWWWVLAKLRKKPANWKCLLLNYKLKQLWLFWEKIYLPSFVSQLYFSEQKETGGK